MRIVEWRYFAGLNPHCHRPMLELVLDLGELSEFSTAERPEIAQALLETIPGLSDHYCGLGFPGGFALRLREGTRLGHVLEHVAIELLHELGAAGKYGKTRQIARTTTYRIAFEAPEAEVGRAAADVGLKYLIALMQRRAFELAVERVRLQRLWAVRCLGPSTQAIADAARRRDIPVRRIGVTSILELGQGQYLRRVQATLTDRSSAVAVDIAGDKERCKEVLRNAGIPVADGEVVQDAEAAVAAARRLGGAVVVKPVSGNQGRGVSPNLHRLGEIRRAVQIAQLQSGPLLVERHLQGRHFRLLVVEGRMVAAAERQPAQVVGDGRHTLAQLVALENEDPRRGEGHERPLTRIRLDDIARICLSRQGLRPTDVPRAGRAVHLRDSANLSTGGTAVDCTDEVAPRLRQLAVRAAQAVGLDVAGIDLIAQDISDDRTDAWVLEVNAAPGIRMHHYPAQGQPRDVAGAILDALFPPGSPARVPIAAITGSNGKTTTVRLVREMLRQRGLVVGFTSTDGHGVGDDYFGRGDDSGPRSAQAVLSDRRVQAAVLEVARGGISRAGLGYDRADVGCILNITGDHLGQDGVETLEQLAHLKALVIEAVRPHGRVVLNADDPRTLELAGRAPAPVVLFSATDGQIAVRRHVAAGGEAVVVAEAQLTLLRDGVAESILPLRDLAFADGGSCRPMLENALAAAACGYALGLLPQEIAQGLRSFRNDPEQNPGRLNLHEIQGVRVVLDYGHNPHAVRAVAPSLRGLATCRLIGVVGMPGDRRDEDAITLGRIASEAFDIVYCKEDRDRRGRAPGEMALRIAQGVRQAGGRPLIVLDEVEALRQALGQSLPGDVVAVFYEHLRPLHAEIERQAALIRPMAEVLDGGR